MSLYFPTPNECSGHTIFPGVRIRTCTGEKMTMSMAELDAHAVVNEHSHPHEQLGLMLEGRVVFKIGDEEKTLSPGDLYRIPSNVLHKVVTLDQPARILDIFYPVREDYR